MSYLISQMFLCLVVAMLIGIWIGFFLCRITNKCHDNSHQDNPVPEGDFSYPPPRKTMVLTEEKPPVVKDNTIPTPADVTIDLDTAIDLDSKAYEIESLEGIGPKTGEMFRDYGVSTVGDYLRKLHTKEARQRAAKDLNILLKPLNDWASMSDLLRVQGIDHQFAELAFASGVKSVEALGGCEASELVAKMEETNNAGRQHIASEVPTTAMVKEWVMRAQTMKKVVKV